MAYFSQVILEYDFNDAFLGSLASYGNFTTLAELQKLIKKVECPKPYSLDINRTFQIIDTQPKEKSRSRYVDQNDEKQKVVVSKKETIKLIVADCLMYPYDVRHILHSQYGGTLNFDTGSKWDENTPICELRVIEQQKTGLRDPKTGAPTYYKLQYVVCRQPNKNEIIVDENLNQLWPNSTHDVPATLVELIKRPKEKIR